MFAANTVFAIPFLKPFTGNDELQMCNSGWGDLMGITFQCMKLQAYYYSPWILGIIGIIILVKSRSYYYGRRKIRY